MAKASVKPAAAGGGGAPDATAHYEFGGPLGAFGILVGLPAVSVALTALCTRDGCPVMAWPPQWPERFSEQLLTLPALAAYVGWFALVAALHVLLPGAVREGTMLRDGTRLTYKLNGLGVMVASLALLLAAHYRGAIDLVWAADNALPLLGASVAFSYVLSLYLYARSFAPGAMLAEGGNTGNVLYDFFIGRELNPRVGAFDLKEFCELYPGLIGWVVLNTAYALKEHRDFGAVGAPTVLVYLFQLLYVADALWFEPAILSTMDITTDGFGFMLAFGDLAWVPFTYSVQCAFLSYAPRSLSTAATVGILALKVVGYSFFRGANSQKDAFRRDPNGPASRHLKYINTERGTRLIVSGYWGIARHVNYTGDLMMGLAWSLPCGSILENPFVYFYPLYFLGLLLHREQRDEEACRKKYGRDWDKYCALVKYRFVPYVY